MLYVYKMIFYRSYAKYKSSLPPLLSVLLCDLRKFYSKKMLKSDNP